MKIINMKDTEKDAEITPSLDLTVGDLSMELLDYTHAPG